MKREKLKKWLMFFCNPRLLLCFGLAWMITNGWSYVVFALGTYFDVSWMLAVSGAYLAFLWLPISPEKLVTIAITITLMRLLFPRDTKTLGLLREMRDKLRAKRSRRDKHPERSSPESDCHHAAVACLKDRITKADRKQFYRK